MNTPPRPTKKELTRHNTAAAERAEAITKRRANQLKEMDPEEYEELYGSKVLMNFNTGYIDPSIAQTPRRTRRNHPPKIRNKQTKSRLVHALNFEEAENKNRANAAAGLLRLGKRKGGSQTVRRRSRRNRR